MCEITKMKTHIVIHIEKRRKCGKLSYTLFYPHYPQTKKPNPVEYGMSKTNSCFVKLSQQSSFCGSLKRNIIVRKKRQLFKMLRKYCLGRGLMV